MALRRNSVPDQILLKLLTPNKPTINRMNGKFGSICDSLSTPLTRMFPTCKSHDSGGWLINMTIDADESYHTLQLT